MKNIIIDYLNKNSVVYRNPIDNIFEFDIENLDGNWKCQIVLKGNAGINIFAVFPDCIPQDELAESALYLMWLNRERVFGNFELDLKTNQILFKTYIDCENIHFNERVLDRTLFINTATMHKYYPDFEKRLKDKKVA